MTNPETGPASSVSIDTETTGTVDTETTEPETYTTSSGAVVSVENGETVVVHPDGSQYVTEGDYYNTVRALAELFPDRF